MNSTMYFFMGGVSFGASRKIANEQAHPAVMPANGVSALGLRWVLARNSAEVIADDGSGDGSVERFGGTVPGNSDEPAHALTHVG